MKNKTNVFRNSFQKGGWWNQRSTLEKSLIVFGAVAFAAAIAFIVAFAVTYNPDNPDSENPEEEVCTSENCIAASSRITSQIDASVEPCDDFFQFACGTWMKKNIIPADRSSINMFGVLRDDVEVTLKNSLEKESNEDISAVKKIKDLYNSCLNLTAIENQGTEPLLDILTLLGGWPVLEPSWNNPTFDLSANLVQLQILNLDPIINMFVTTDFKDSSKRIIYIDQPSFGMPGRSYYLRGRDDVMVQAYEKYGVELAMNLGADSATATTDIKDLVDFEFLLANISVAAEDRRDSEALYNPGSITDLAANYSKFDWQNYFYDIFNMDGVGLNITADEIIINRSPSYFNLLFDILENTPTRVKANYILFRLVLQRAPYLTATFRELLVDYNKVITGSATERDRFRTCVVYVQNNVGVGVGRIFIDETFDEDAKSTALEMIENIRSAFFELLNELDWMDDSTRQLAREKAEYINEKIGYADAILDDVYLNKLYENHTYDPHDYFNNVDSDQRRSIVTNLKDLREPVDKDAWSTNAATVNAFYSPQKNQIMFPAGILQPPFFHKNYPRALNYGGIGVVIGHEITHGFDDSGRQYDKDGNLLQWWTDDVIDRFKEKAQCIIDQYSNYTVEEADMNLNGINTQGENIADNGGLKQSYRAYQTLIETMGNEQRLPGLKYNNKQLFFINFAQIWCTNTRREAAIQQILTGVHSLGRFRVIGSLQNSQDFAEAFNCPASSYMNAENKCYVW
ncbi:hypothetical protein SNE40_015099 [Patella caerulea]|uniref:Neprilysin n=1 Tax=Patella caerulea TaxID=87958 RepID=A0AAN8JJD6_PATCE